MNKKWGLLIKIFMVAVLSLGALRLWHEVAQPRVLFQVVHMAFVVMLLVFMAWMSFSLWRDGRSLPPGKVHQPFSEPLALIYTSFLIVVAFILLGWSWIYADKPRVTLIPYLFLNGHLAKASTAAGIILVTIWTVYLYLQRKFPHHDPFIYPIVALLSAVGLIFLYRLGPDIAHIRGKEVFNGLFRQQLRAWGLSFLFLLFSVGIFSGKRISYLTRKRYIYAVLAIILIAITATWGVEHHGRKLAVRLFFMDFQTVELVKLLALFFMVGYFRYEMGYLEADKGRLGLPRARFWIPYLIMWGLVLLSLVLQKDLGPAVLLFCLFLTVFYIGTGSGAIVIIGFILMIAVGVLSYWIDYPSMVRTRVDMWLDPFANSQNLAESLWAVGSGNFFGTGIGQGLAHYIPVVQSDFNFAVIAEEWGLIGVVAILWSFALLIGRTLVLGKRADKPYVQMLVAGLATLWLVQVFVIVAGNIALMPLTGITLPFISYGGSSLVMNMVALGIILRFSHEQGVT